MDSLAGAGAQRARTGLRQRLLVEFLCLNEIVNANITAVEDALFSVLENFPLHKKFVGCIRQIMSSQSKSNGPSSVAFGEWLRQLREQKGELLREVAAAAEMDVAHL